MKTTLFSTVLCSSMLIAPIMAKASTRATNDVALEVLNHVKSIFAAGATASDAQKAKAAVSTINSATARIVSLQSVLKASPMPNAEEKKAFAQKMLHYESQVSVVLKKMTSTFNSNPESVNKIIQPAITNFKAKTTATMTLISTYYPKKEMQGYMTQLKGK